MKFKFYTDGNVQDNTLQTTTKLFNHCFDVRFNVKNNLIKNTELLLVCFKQTFKENNFIAKKNGVEVFNGNINNFVTFVNDLFKTSAKLQDEEDVNVEKYKLFKGKQDVVYAQFFFNNDSSEGFSFKMSQDILNVLSHGKVPMSDFMNVLIETEKEISSKDASTQDYLDWLNNKAYQHNHVGKITDIRELHFIMAIIYHLSKVGCFKAEDEHCGCIFANSDGKQIMI